MGSPTLNQKVKRSSFHAYSRSSTEDTQQIYESLARSSHNIRINEIMSDEIAYAANITAADAEAAANDAVTKHTLVTLTEHTGSNGQTYKLIVSGEPVKPWIDPADIQNSSGDFSGGYQARLYRSDNSEIPLAEGVWSIDYNNGLFLFEPGSTPSDQGWGAIKATVYAYTGKLGVSREVDHQPILKPKILHDITHANLASVVGAAVRSDYLFTLSSSLNRITSINISNPRSMTYVSSHQENTYMGNPNDLIIDGKYAYTTGISTHSVAIFDISNPSSMTTIGGKIDASLLTNAYALYKQGIYLYVTAPGSHRFTILDVSDPTNLKITDSYPDATDMNSPSSVYIYSGYAYVTAPGSGKIKILNVSDPYNITSVDAIAVSTNVIRLAGNHSYLYTTDNSTNDFKIYSLTDPTSPTLLATLPLAGIAENIQPLFITGDYVYLGTEIGLEPDGRQIARIDVRDKTNPKISGYLNDTTGKIFRSWGMVVSKNSLFVASLGTSRIVSLDITQNTIQTVQIGQADVDKLKTYNKSEFEQGLHSGGPISCDNTVSAKNFDGVSIILCHFCFRNSGPGVQGLLRSESGFDIRRMSVPFDTYLEGCSIAVDTDVVGTVNFAFELYVDQSTTADRTTVLTSFIALESKLVNFTAGGILIKKGSWIEMKCSAGDNGAEINVALFGKTK